MNRTSRRGFTLIEMLVVIMIVGMLATMTLAALSSAERAAKEARTKATIAKIDKFIMQKYASYQHRRAPVNLTGKSPKEAAQVRLAAIRQLQMLEMPDAVEDFKDTSRYAGGIPYDTNASYTRFNAQVGQTTNSAYTPAELLYLIIMGMEGAQESFSQMEIGDVDGNGLKEFIDGWGRPIFFIRWPALYLPGNNVVTSLQTGDATADHDPFDDRGVDASAYAVYPLVYSFGADGMAGLIPSTASAAEYSTIKNGTADMRFYKPYARPKVALPGGNVSGGDASSNTPDPSSLLHFDNITNHALDR